MACRSMRWPTLPGRAVAAGAASVTQLNGNATRTVHIQLLGRAAEGASVHVHASPTIFN